MNFQQSMIVDQLKTKHNIDFNVDFHSLNSEQVEAINYWAKAYGYRHPKNANGSKARYFFYFLVKLVNKG